jgi:hypothetical protein
MPARRDIETPSRLPALAAAFAQPLAYANYNVATHDLSRQCAESHLPSAIFNFLN